MNKNFDVIALGELLIDFTENGVSGQGNPIFEANPGGAPCNVLAMLNNLGKKTTFLGVVGKYQFGTSLRNTLNSLGIDTSHLYEDQEVHTTLAFVHTFEDGDRDFAFYRNPGADMMLSVDQIDEEYIRSAKAFHFGTLSMTHEGVRGATIKAIDCAKQGGALLSFDPNLRPPLWGSLDQARAEIEYGLAQCHILKIADNELEFMTGETDFDRGAAILRKKYPNIRLFNVTAGAEGSYSYYEDQRVFVPACKLGGTIETTGAGDTFCACVLNFVLERGLDGLSREDLTGMLRFANTAAYLVTTRKGAIRSMPERAEVEALLG